MRGNKNHADGRRDIDSLVCRRQLAGLRIDLQKGQVIGILVGGDDEFARRVDLKVARALAQSGLRLLKGQGSIVLIDVEDRNGIAAAVGGIEMAADLSTSISAAVLFPLKSGGREEMVCMGCRAPVARS